MNNDRSRYHVIILGGGPSGLAAAERLVRSGARVLLIEKDAELGGLARSFRQDGKWLPMTYHHIMGVDTVTHHFLKRFDLWDSMLWEKIKVVFWFHARPFPLTQPWHIPAFAPLSWLDRLRLIKLGLICYFKRNWHHLDDVKCDEWMDGIIGRRAREALFDPLAEMEFGIPLSSVSTGWLGSRLRESARNRDCYGYPSRDLKALIDAIAASIESKGGRIMRGTETARVGREAVAARDSAGHLHKFHAPHIISTLPPEILLRIHEEPQCIDMELETIRYRPLICMVFGSRQLISPHYWNIFIEPLLHFGGIFNHTALCPGSGVSGEYVYYLFTYSDEGSPLYQMPEDELAETYKRDIRRICPDFDYLWRRIFKIRYSTPFYVIGYKNPPIKSRYPGLYYAGVYRKYPATRTMNSAFQSGCETADYIHARRQTEGA